jgi:SNF2 family DNA or RNA helicase
MKRRLCTVCRDGEDLEIGLQCVDCQGWFHRECGGVTTRYSAEFHCDDCRESQNAKCSTCSKRVGTADTILCDTCESLHHYACSGLSESIGDEDPVWNCQKCLKSDGDKKTRAVSSGKKEELKSDFCFVCQSAGRLLVCEYCPKAYHPSCIMNFFTPESFLNENTKWKCPVCEGHSVLQKKQPPKISVSALKKRCEERNSSNRKSATFLRIQRNRFLKSNLDLIKPFISEKFAKELKVTKAADLKQTIEDVFEGKFPNGGCGTLLAEGYTLKDYQVEAVNWLNNCYENLTGAILALPMGTGKCAVSLAFISYLHSKGGVKGPHLVVAPLSTIGNWQNEAEKFVPHLTVGKLCGGATERSFALNKDDLWYGERDIYITSYESLVTTESFFSQHCWHTVILDEGHRIKGQAGRLKTCLERLESVFRVLLSGTPLQNNMMDLYELLHALWPDVLESSKPFENSLDQGIVKDPVILDHIKRLLGKLMLYRKKEDIIQLPQKIQHMIWLPLSHSAADWYNKVLSEKSKYENEYGETIGVRKLLGILSHLRQVTCHPAALTVKGGFFAEEALSDLGHLTGMDHVKLSNKLVFLDKMLCTLLALNSKHFRVGRAQPRSDKKYEGEGFNDIPKNVDIDFATKIEPDMAGKRGRVLVFSQFG